MTNLLGKLVGPYTTIYTLHRATPSNGAYGGHDVSLLQKCLDAAVKKKYRFASIDQIICDAQSETPNTEPTICFTLDDGFKDQADLLLPVLLDYQAHPTLFVITDFIEEKIWPWDSKIAYLTWHTPLSSASIQIGTKTLHLDFSSPEHRRISRRKTINVFRKLNPELHSDYLDKFAAAVQMKIPFMAPEDFQPTTWNALRQLEIKGLRIGSHTENHLVFESASEDRILRELSSSANTLRREITAPSDVFCYPLGTATDFRLEHEHLVAKAGYKAAVTTVANVTNLKEIKRNPFQIQRIGFPNTLEKFVRYSSWKEALRSKLPF